MTGDRDLCRRAAAGDRQAFADLYGRYADTVRRMLLARGVPSDVAWDLLSETFARALRSFDRGHAPERFDLWIRTLALNAVTDHHRRAHFRHEVPWDPAILPETVDSHQSAPPPEGLGPVVDRLGPLLKNVVVLHFYQDLSVSEVARVLGIPEGTVKSRLSRAYRQLADELRLEDDTPEQARAGPAAQGPRYERLAAPSEGRGNP